MLDSGRNRVTLPGIDDATFAVRRFSEPLSISIRQLLHDLNLIYRERVGKRTAAFREGALKAQALERLRALIEAVVLTPEDGALTMDERGELGAMLLLCAGAETQKAPAGEPLEVMQIRMVAGTGFEPVTFRL